MTELNDRQDLYPQYLVLEWDCLSERVFSESNGELPPDDTDDPFYDIAATIWDGAQGVATSQETLRFDETAFAVTSSFQACQIAPAERWRCATRYYWPRQSAPWGQCPLKVEIAQLSFLTVMPIPANWAVSNPVNFSKHLPKFLPCNQHHQRFPRNFAAKREVSPQSETFNVYEGTWKTKNARPIADRLAMNSWVDRVASKIMHHEGGFRSINWNDNGAGISVGTFQANQRQGELPALLKNMERADPNLFKDKFGESFQNIVKNSPQKIRTLSFCNSTQTGPNELGWRLKGALEEPLFQQVQLNMLRNKVLHAACVAGQYGIKSEAGIALVADMINQLGEGASGVHSKPWGARRYLQYCLTKNDEKEKLVAIAKHDYKGDGRQRRDKDILFSQAIADGYQTAQTE